MTAYERMIADAAMNPEKRKDCLEKITAKMIASTRIFCPTCKMVLDQNGIGWLEEEDTPIAVFCKRCPDHAMQAVKRLADSGKYGVKLVGVCLPNSDLPVVRKTRRNPYPDAVWYRHMEDGWKDFTPHSFLYVAEWDVTLAVCKDGGTWRAIEYATGLQAFQGDTYRELVRRGRERSDKISKDSFELVVDESAKTQGTRYDRGENE